MGRTACTEPQCLYKGALYLYLLPKGKSLNFKGVYTVDEKGYFRHLQGPKSHCYTNANKSLHYIPSHLSPVHKIHILFSEIFEPSNYEILIRNLYEF